VKAIGSTAALTVISFIEQRRKVMDDDRDIITVTKPTITLREDELDLLIRGGTVESKSVKILLADVTYARMGELAQRMTTKQNAAIGQIIIAKEE
jgi:hypothetical protein